MADHFNTLEYARQLEAAGVPKAQAEVHANTLAQVIDNCVTVPPQLMRLKHEFTTALSEVENRLYAEIAASESRLETKITKAEFTLRTEISAAETRLNEKFQELQKQIGVLRWTNGAVIALLIAVLAQGYFR